MFLWLAVKSRSVPRNSWDISNRKKMEQTEQVLQTEDAELCASVALSQGINTRFLSNQLGLHTNTPQQYPQWKLNTSVWIATLVFRLIFRLGLCWQALPLHFSQDNFKHSSLSRTLFILPSIHAPEELSPREVQTFTKHPLAKHLCTHKLTWPFFFGQCLFWGKAKLLFQAVHFVVQSNSSEFLFS